MFKHTSNAVNGVIVKGSPALTVKKVFGDVFVRKKPSPQTPSGQHF